MFIQQMGNLNHGVNIPPRSPLTTESTTGYSGWKTSAQSSPDTLVWM